MSSPGVTVEHLAAGANRQTAVADWSRTGLLAYGTDCNVALWRPAVSYTEFFCDVVDGFIEYIYKNTYIMLIFTHSLPSYLYESPCLMYLCYRQTPLEAYTSSLTDTKRPSRPCHSCQSLKKTPRHTS